MAVSGLRLCIHNDRDMVLHIPVKEGAEVKETFTVMEDALGAVLYYEEHGAAVEVVDERVALKCS
ncbi:hypothetical protein FT641_18810 [Bacillus paranthracis]|uniref:hypothetical protein n=1 Tax=Bacillus paranthracis TaxID=2026186 RepID=UPI001879C68B|nr:hypothetical protein [Bacillus paranthracis]MBE7114384.1 hypothetical protein [Bacillus paranthracis]MBE7154743.1 hypothetical protein [Bacillus paranthracis]